VASAAGGEPAGAAEGPLAILVVAALVVAALVVAALVVADLPPSDTARR